MNIFHELANKLNLLDPLTIFVEFAKQRDVNTKAINAIQKRLYSKGITGDGIELQTDSSGTGEVYSPVTIKFKDEHGDPTNRVTLKNSGEFYDSMAMIVSKLYIEIDADFIKDDHMQVNFEQQFSNPEHFEDSILSLNEKEIVDIFINQFLVYYTKKVNEIFKV